MIKKTLASYLMRMVVSCQQNCSRFTHLLNLPLKANVHTHTSWSGINKEQQATIVWESCGATLFDCYGPFADMSCLSCLPDEVLKAIMALIPFKDRLTSCCLVSKKLHAAAVAATECLELQYLPSQRAGSLPGWLSHYGQHLTRLHLGCTGFILQQLPCPMLLELRVRNDYLDVKLEAVQQCTKLTRLELQCNITGNHVPGADCLSSLGHLQHLRMLPALQKCPLSRATLGILQHLTHLETGLTVDNFLQLGDLASLQELTLHTDWDSSYTYTPVGPNNVPCLEFPPFLKKLCLLDDVEAALFSLIPTGLERLEVERGVWGPAEGPDSFLSGLARLQSLTSLYVDPGKDKGMPWPPAGPAYAALTASSNLVSLEVKGFTGSDGIGMYVFPATHTLPHLTLFAWSSALRGEDGNDVDPLPVWGAGDLASLVSCCPGLSDIQDLHLQPGLHVSELHKLTDLTRLCVNYSCEDMRRFRESMGGLAAVSQLHEVEVTLVCQHFELSSLLPLANLTALTYLRVEWPSDAEDGSDQLLLCRVWKVSKLSA